MKTTWNYDYLWQTKGAGVGVQNFIQRKCQEFERHTGVKWSYSVSPDSVQFYPSATDVEPIFDVTKARRFVAGWKLAAKARPAVHKLVRLEHIALRAALTYKDVCGLAQYFVRNKLASPAVDRLGAFTMICNSHMTFAEIEHKVAEHGN